MNPPLEHTDKAGEEEDNTPYVDEVVRSHQEQSGRGDEACRYRSDADKESLHMLIVDEAPVSATDEEAEDKGGKHHRQCGCD